MNCGKTAQALMCKYNYEQVGFDVLLLKPSIDTRDIKEDKIITKSRIGLNSECLIFDKMENLYSMIYRLNQFDKMSVVIIDECQFCTTEQINQLKQVSTEIPVLCYGLLTNFKTKLFEGSKRLIEIAESVVEIKSVCRCGKKASINARFIDDKLVTDGEEVLIGGNDTYKGMCYDCYTKMQKGMI